MGLPDWTYYIHDDEPEMADLENDDTTPSFDELEPVFEEWDDPFPEVWIEDMEESRDAC